VVLLAIPVDVSLEPLGKCVYDREANPVEAAGHLVAAAAELAARVQDGEHDLERAAAVLLLVDRDPATVVLDGDAAVGVDGDEDLGAVAGERLELSTISQTRW